MKNDNNIPQQSYNSTNNQKYVLTSPNKSPNYHLLLKDNNYLLKSKHVFKFEKKKEKENIFQIFKEVPKKQIKKEQVTLNNNYKHLLKSISILNNANIDEGIILNKYFTYLKNSGYEFDQYMILKYKNMLTPIRKKEKEIQKLKKDINFYKSISNLMLMKYMIENKDKLNEYVKEAAKHKKDKSEFFHGYDKHRNILYSSNKRNHTSKNLNEGNNRFLTCSNNNINRKKYLREQLNKKYVPKLKLIPGENNKNIHHYNDNDNEIFITCYSRNKNKLNNKNKALTTVHTPKNSFSINNKYYTPQASKRNNKLYNLNIERSMGKTNYSSRKSCKIQNFDFNSFFNIIKEGN